MTMFKCGYHYIYPDGIIQIESSEYPMSDNGRKHMITMMKQEHLDDWIEYIVDNVPNKKKKEWRKILKKFE